MSIFLNLKNSLQSHIWSCGPTYSLLWWLLQKYFLITKTYWQSFICPQVFQTRVLFMTFSTKLGKTSVGIDGTWIIEVSIQTRFYSRLISQKYRSPHILSFSNKDNVSLFSYTSKCLNWYGIASGKFSIFLIHKFPIILTPRYDDCRSTPPDSHTHLKYFFQFLKWEKYHLILPLKIWLKH
jgi:hypothetical protein